MRTQSRLGPQYLAKRSLRPARRSQAPPRVRCVPQCLRIRICNPAPCKTNNTDRGQTMSFFEMVNPHAEVHRGQHAGWLRAAVLGANDGLVAAR